MSDWNLSRISRTPDGLELISWIDNRMSEIAHSTVMSDYDESLVSRSRGAYSALLEIKLLLTETDTPDRT